MSKTDEKWNRLMDDMTLHPLVYCKRRGIDLSGCEPDESWTVFLEDIAKRAYEIGYEECEEAARP